MMRIQILPLPTVCTGDDVEEPFALIVDQFEWPLDESVSERWKQFKDMCGARAVLVDPGTVEIVDRYADAPEVDQVAIREFGRLDDYLLMHFADEPGMGGDGDLSGEVAIRLLEELRVHRPEPKPAPDSSVPGNAEALRELHRLAEYVHDNFPDEAAKGGGTVVDVAMRLLGQELIRRDVVETRIRFDFPEPFDADKVAELLNRRDVGKRRTTEPMGYTLVEGIPGNALLRGDVELATREGAIARWGSLVPLHGEGPFTVCKVVPLDEQEQA